MPACDSPCRQSTRCAASAPRRSSSPTWPTQGQVNCVNEPEAGGGAPRKAPWRARGLRRGLGWTNCKAAVDAVKPGEVLSLENLRFHPVEEANDPNFARALAANGDLYIDDAFSAAHRAHASTVGVARLLPAFAGEDMRRELQALRAALDHPAHPVLGVVGCSKVSTKLDMLLNLILTLDRLASHRRRHGQYVHFQSGMAGRRLHLREGSGQRRARHHGIRQKAQLRALAPG
jgi:hypothetical protein